MKNRLSTFTFLIIILIISIIAYFWFFIYAPIYDFADEFFPGRYFMFESIQNKIFPIWLPYQSMGLPVHADPQSGTFYLPLWIMSIFGGYTPYTWGIEFVLHIFFAGSGFFLLSKRFVKNDIAAFTVACCYMLSGFFTGNAQHISWIIAGAWLPWLIKFMLDFFDHPSPKFAVSIALMASLLFTGGYPGFSFIIFYLFLIFFIYSVIHYIRNKSKDYFKKLIPNLFLSVILCLLLILPSFISLIEVKDYITRGEILSYEKASVINFTPKSFISLIFPWVSCSEGDFTGTDISMGSIYTGFLTLFFFILGLFQKKSADLKILGYWGLFCLLLSLGSALPFHKWAFNIIPLFDMIRIPAIFRIFPIIALLLIAVVGFEKFVDNFHHYQKKFITFLLLSIGAFFIFSIILIISDISVLKDSFSFDFTSILNQSILHKLFYESLFQIILLSILLISLFAGLKFPVRVLIPVILIDLVFNVWICTQHTGFMRDFTNRKFTELLAEKPKGFPVPEEVTSSGKIYSEENYGNLWRNLGVFSKKIEWDSYIGVILKSHEEMLRPYFQSGRTLQLPAVIFFPGEVLFSETPIFFNSDTAYTNNPDLVASHKESSTIEIKKFIPGEIVFTTESNIQRAAVVCQNYYPGWKAMINETSAKIEIANNSLISVLVPAGKHKVTLLYKRPDLEYGFLTELITWFSCILFLLTVFYINNKKRKSAS